MGMGDYDAAELKLGWFSAEQIDLEYLCCSLDKILFLSKFRRHCFSFGLGKHYLVFYR